MRRLVLIAIVAANIGCSSDAFQLGSGQPDTDVVVTEVSSDSNSDTTEPDAGEEEDSEPVDSSVVDSGADTTVVTVDSGKDTATDPADTGKLDTGKVDSGIDSGTIDSGPFDTGAFDSGFDTRPDSGPFDSGTFDSGTFDSGTFDSTTVFDSISGTDSISSSDSTSGDGAPVCPQPASTLMVSVMETKCETLATQYAAKAQEARRCNCDADCSVEIAKDFCGCTTAVNPGNDAYRYLAAIQSQWDKGACLVTCTEALCLPAVMNKCVVGTGGKFCAPPGALSGGGL